MTRWALPIVFAVLISTVWRITVVPGQTLPESAKASPAPVKAALMAEIAFYLARGEADACGRGCDQWIAAEGKIDATAAQRLRRLLAKLQNRRPPIFFHSPGGSITGSLELGRLIRAQKLEVSVAHTIPRGCDRNKPLDKACEALKRSGQELEADFDPAISMCNSSCVWVLAGGIARFVPPRVKLGIHEVGLLDPDKALPRGTSVADVKRVAHARILEYAREMGIDKALPAAAFAVPNESPRFLGRDEVVRYGIDRREFGETVWHFDDKSAAAMFKSFFVRTDGGDQPRYSNGFVRLSCGAGRDIRLAFSQEDLVKSADPPTIRIDVNGQRIMLTSRQADTHSTLLSADMFDFVGRGSDIKVSGIEQGRNEGSARSVTLNMDGFSGASVKLRQNCDDWHPKPVPTVTFRSDHAEQERIEDDQKRAQSLPVQPLPPPADGFGPPPKSVPTVTIRSDQAEQKRIEPPAGRFGPPPNTFTPGPVR
jgi:hypothetical protein